jgi:hypothetical protein
MKQRIQVLEWKRHKHEVDNAGAGVEKTQA